MIRPEWPAPARVQALMTTREDGDVSAPEAERRLHAWVPSGPRWLRQVHGTTAILHPRARPEGDAAVARMPGVVCAVMAADCMPVLFADEEGTVVGAAHAGWRGLAAGVLESTMEAMRVPPDRLFAWLGPAIGPRVYEVGDEVLAAFRGYESAFSPTRPGHWLLDLYAVAREKLKHVKHVSGGGFCTHSDRERFFSYRRDRGAERMAALIWLT